jgi:hypothetical protein
VAFSSQANYTDWATAACWWSRAQTHRGKKKRWHWSKYYRTISCFSIHHVI